MEKIFYLLGQDESFSNFEMEKFSYAAYHKLNCLQIYNNDDRVLFFQSDKYSLHDILNNEQISLNDAYNFCLFLTDFLAKLHDLGLSKDKILFDTKAILNSNISFANNDWNFLYLPINCTYKKNYPSEIDLLYKVFLSCRELRNFADQKLSDFEHMQIMNLMEAIQRGPSDIINFFKSNQDLLLNGIGKTKQLSKEIKPKKNLTTENQAKKREYRVKTTTTILPREILENKLFKHFQISKNTYLVVSGLCFQVIYLVIFLLKSFKILNSLGKDILFSSSFFKTNIIIVIIFLLINTYAWLRYVKNKNTSTSHKKFLMPKPRKKTSNKSILVSEHPIESRLFQEARSFIIEKFPFILSNERSISDKFYFYDIKKSVSLLFMKNDSNFILENQSNHEIFINGVKLKKEKNLLFSSPQ